MERSGKFESTGASVVLILCDVVMKGIVGKSRDSHRSPLAGPSVEL